MMIAMNFQRSIYCIYHNNEVLGPYNPQEIYEMYFQGVISGETLVNQGQGEEWVPFDTIKAHLENNLFPKYQIKAKQVGVKSVSVLSKILIIVFIAIILCNLTLSGSYLKMAVLLEAGDYERIDSLVHIEDMILLPQNLCIWVSKILFLFWISAVARNASAMSVFRFPMSPGWNVGWYFIPIANLVKPHEGMVNIFNASMNPAVQYKKGNALITAWWLLFLGSHVFMRVSDRGIKKMETTEMEISEIVSTLNLTAGAMLSVVIAAVFAILIVRKVCGLQEAYLKEKGRKQR